MAPSFQSIWLDYNHDGFPDLYIINDRTTWENKFYENNGDGTFTNVTLLTQTAMGGSDPMSISLGDYDNDGDQDLFVSDAASASQPRGTLFGQTFTFDYIDQASSLGISIPANMWGSTWLDYNNDGFLDLFVATGDIPIAKNYFYVSDSANNFLQDTSIFVGDYVSNSFAVASADFNRDGFSDIAVVNLGASTNFLWLNSQNSNNYIRISVEGTVSNSAAIGTWIKVFANNQVYTKYTVCGENYLGQNSQHHNFGVGQDTIVDSVHVEYLSGIIDKYYNLPVNERYDFTEGESIASFNVSIIGNNPFCQGDSVSLTAPVLQSYNWSNGDTTQSIVVYSQDTFELCGIDSNGLTVQSNMYFIEEIPFPSVASQLVDVSCHGEMDGEAYLRVNNEGQEYQMTWSNGLSGDSLLGLGAGIYTYSYIDIYGCSFQDSFELGNPSPLNVQVEIQAQTWGEQGSVQVLANGGVAPYIISLDNLPINNQLTLLDSGIYILTIVDGNDCSYVDTIIVLFQDSAIISSSINTAEAQLVVSPNPFTDKLMVELTNVQSSFLLWELFDSSGKLITKNEENILVLKGNYEFQISIPTSMPVGIFYLQIVFGNEVDQFKLIKQ